MDEQRIDRIKNVVDNNVKRLYDNNLVIFNDALNEVLDKISNEEKNFIIYFKFLKPNDGDIISLNTKDIEAYNVLTKTGLSLKILNYCNVRIMYCNSSSGIRFISDIYNFIPGVSYCFEYKDTNFDKIYLGYGILSSEKYGCILS